MCGSSPKPPKVVERDPIAEAAEAERLGAIKANESRGARRRNLRASSLLTFGGRGVQGPVRESAISQAKGLPQL